MEIHYLKISENINIWKENMTLLVQRNIVVSANNNNTFCTFLSLFCE